MASKRARISPKGDSRYIRRDSKGRIKESDDVGRSLAGRPATRIERGRRRYLGRILHGLRPRLYRLGTENPATYRQPVRRAGVTHVLGTFCYLCVRAGHRNHWLRGLATATICFSMLWHCHATPGTFQPLGEEEHQSGRLGVGSSNLPAPTNTFKGLAMRPLPHPRQK